jgi:hypothetical protein
MDVRDEALIRINEIVTRWEQIRQLDYGSPVVAATYHLAANEIREVLEEVASAPGRESDDDAED